MWLAHVSLLDGWLPVVTTVSAWGALAFGVAWWRRAVWHWLVVATASGVIAAFIAWWIDIPARVGSTYPRSFLVWGALPMFALGAALWQWRVVGWWRRTGALVAVPLLAAWAGLTINSHYAYLPTVGDLIGAPLPGQVDARQLDRGTGSEASAARTVRIHPKLGEVTELDIPATVSHFGHRPAYVWVPPAYFDANHPHLPVLMLLAGTPGAPGDWLRGGRALALADAWATAHGGDAPMLVLPDANGGVLSDTECVDGPRGRAETYLTVDVVAFMVRHFGASSDPRHWAIAGLSEGGTCALVLVARHPDRFATFGDFGGDPAPTLDSPERTLRLLYGGSSAAELAHDPVRWFGKDAARGVEGFFSAGSTDHGFLRDEERLATIARRYGMRVHLDVVAGHGHTFRTWARSLQDAYPWLVSRLDQQPAYKVAVAEKDERPSD